MFDDVWLALIEFRCDPGGWHQCAVDKSGEKAAGWHLAPKRVGARSDLPIVANMVLSIYCFVLTCKNTNIRMFAEQPRRPYCSEQDRLADVFSTDIFARKGGMSEACWLTRLEDPAALPTTTWVAFGCWHGRIYAILWSLICILSGKINNLCRSFQILSWSP